MSIQGEISRITGNVQATLETIAATGVSVGTNSDALPAAASALATTKQDVLSGSAGQVVGFDSAGRAVARDVSDYPLSVLATGYVGFRVNDEGHLICDYTGDAQPNYSINNEGHLILTTE